MKLGGRRAWLRTCGLLAGLPLAARAQAVLRIAGRVHPDFPAPDAFKSATLWDAPDFLAGWSAARPELPEQHRVFPGKCNVFGQGAHSVAGLFEAGRLSAITVVVLDAGAWFGFVPDAEAKKVAAAKGAQFSAHYRKVAADVQRGLEGIAARAGKRISFIEKGPLKHDALLFQTGDLWTRLTLRDDQLVKLTVARTEADAASPLGTLRRTAKKDVQARFFTSRVSNSANGDRQIAGLPIFLQGYRAYCGVATLAMAMQFLGLRLDTEDYAASAGIKFGSTYQSDIRETADAAASAGGLRMPRTVTFDFAQAKASIDAGFPVIVFRWWRQERDFVHHAFLERFRNDPAAVLPKADMNDRKTWPARSDFAHSSVITGYNIQRGEVIFTESWGERARDRRMRIEEMAATVYQAYYPRL